MKAFTLSKLLVMELKILLTIGWFKSKDLHIVSDISTVLGAAIGEIMDSSG
jgi:hypothetical protein